MGKQESAADTLGRVSAAMRRALDAGKRDAAVVEEVRRELSRPAGRDGQR